MRSLTLKAFVAILRIQGYKKLFSMEGEELIQYTLKQQKKGKSNPPKKMYKQFRVSQKQICNATCYKFAPLENKSNKIVIYIHGGGYFIGAQSIHWSTVSKIVKETNALVYFPDYPLAPTHSVDETTNMLVELYRNLIRTHKPEDISFMGDSAGGGISLSMALTFKELNLPQPKNFILISPSSDLSSNPPLVPIEIEEIEKKDPILSYKSLDTICDMWRGQRERTDYHVAPTHGDLSGLGHITIFAGTDDVLTVYSKNMVVKAKEQGIDIDFHLKKDMIHCYPIMPIPDAKADLELIMQLIRGQK